MPTPSLPASVRPLLTQRIALNTWPRARGAKEPQVIPVTPFFFFF